MSRGLKSLAIFFAVVVIFSLSHHTLGPIGTTTTTSLPETTTTTYTSTCVPGDLKAVDMGGQGAAGTVYGQIGITKNSGASCVLYGYALVTYQDGYGTVLPIHISHSPVDHLAFFADSSANKLPTMVRMSIGSVAKIDYSYSDVSTSSSGCVTVTQVSLQLRMGATTIPVKLRTTGTFAPCGGKTLISPYF